MKSGGWMLSALCLLVMLSAGCVLDAPYSKYAITYGVSIYDSGLPEGSGPNLRYADDDAISVAAMLGNQGYSVLLRIDSQATKAQLLSDIAEVVSKAKEGDLFLFYFSGHGGQAGTGAEAAFGDSQNEWIFLHGSVDPLNLAATVNDDQLISALAAIPCRRKVIILDSCNSGGFLGNALETDGTDLPTTIVDTISLYANFDGSSADIPPWEAMVIGASGEQESSYESPGPDPLDPGPLYYHGVFTYFLLQAERNADRNRDGYITVTEAYYYVRTQINAEWSSPHVSGGPVDYVLFQAR
jgi:hypothetical protein